MYWEVVEERGSLEEVEVVMVLFHSSREEGE
jgi:hypothetical protein